MRFPRPYALCVAAMLAGCQTPSPGVLDAGFTDAGRKADGGVPGDGGVGSTLVTVVPVARVSGRPISITPVFIAWRSGDGAWTPLQAGADGGYSFEVTASDGRYALVLVCPPAVGNYTTLLSYAATAAEMPRVNADFCHPPADYVESLVDETLSTRAWPCSATGVNASYGNGSALFNDPSMPLTQPATAGPHDVFAVAQHPAGTSFAPDAYLLLHDVSFTEMGSLELDFSAAVAPKNFQLTYGGLTAEDIVPFVDVALWTARSFFSLGSGSGSGSLVHGMPPSALGPTDMHRLMVGSGGPDAKQRSAFRFVTSPVDTTLTPPPFLTSATMTAVATAPYVRPAFTWDGAPSGSAFFSFVSQGTRSWYSYVTPGGLAGARTLAMPDLSTVAGWDNGWGFVTGVTADFSLAALSGSASFDLLLHGFMFQNLPELPAAMDGFVSLRHAKAEL